MQFVITAYDGENMLEKRMSVRPRHLENMARRGIIHKESIIVLTFSSDLVENIFVLTP